MRSAAPAHGSRHIPRLGWGFLACVLTLAPPPAPVAAQGVADRAPAPARFDLTLEDAPVERVLQRLAGHHGLSVVFEDGAIRAAEVTLALHQVTAIEAARAVLLATHHAFAVESDIVIVFGPEAPRRDRDAAQHDRAPATRSSRALRGRWLESQPRARLRRTIASPASVATIPAACRRRRASSPESTSASSTRTST
jgi:hypothetical protein